MSEIRAAIERVRRSYEEESINRGVMVEDSVFKLISLLLKPLKFDKEQIFMDRGYDARVKISSRKELLIEIFSGIPSTFRYKTIADSMHKYYDNKNRMLLYISKDYNKNAMEYIKKINIVPKWKLLFIDYNQLIKISEKSYELGILDSNKSIKIGLINTLFSQGPIIDDIKSFLDRLDLELINEHAPKRSFGSPAMRIDEIRISANDLRRIEETINQLISNYENSLIETQNFKEIINSLDNLIKNYEYSIEELYKLRESLRTSIR